MNQKPHRKWFGPDEIISLDAYSSPPIHAAPYHPSPRVVAKIRSIASPLVFDNGADVADWISWRIPVWKARGVRAFARKAYAAAPYITSRDMDLAKEAAMVRKLEARRSRAESSPPEIIDDTEVEQELRLF